jgi:3-dehydroquinate dehydratase / shikimate dehydrogenase
MAHPLLCVTVTASSTSDLLARRDAAARVADLVELRLDGVRDVDVPAVLSGRTRPVIVTCRSRQEGGVFDGGEAARLTILRAAAAAGAEFVDIEWTAEYAPLIAERRGRGIVLSSHDFAGVPADLADRCRAMRATGAEVVKVAVMARSLCDVLPLLSLGRRAEDGAAGRLALIAMGTAGLASRVLPARFGSCWSYAGEAVAPGQVSADRMLGEFRFRQVTSATRVFGVVGKPILHSVSPAMHNAAFGAVGVDAVYLPLAAASADDFRRFAAAVGLEGASVTAPFKRELFEGAGVVRDDPAAVLGAANTLKRERGGWVARNTDVAGFLAPLDAAGIALTGLRVAVVGSGGAARAVAWAAASRGAHVTVHGRDRARAQTASAGVPLAVATGEPPSAGQWDVLVKATPAGTWPADGESPVDAAALRGGGLVYDLVYNPSRTRLMTEAAAAGCRVVGGLEMLVAQAAAQFEWWTGKPAPVSIMRAAAEERLMANSLESAGDR